MNDVLFLLVGKSASGKSTIANILEKQYEYKQLQSYTTRKPRYKKEPGHIFLSKSEFEKLENIVAYTEYSGSKYCATADQIDKCNVYVVDVPGVETLLQKYQSDRPIVIIYFSANIRTRIDRMIDRHDSDMEIVSRIYNDEKFDWEDRLNKAVWNYKYNEGKNIVMYTVYANQDIDSVFSQVKNIIDTNLEED